MQKIIFIYLLFFHQLTMASDLVLRIGERKVIGKANSLWIENGEILKAAETSQGITLIGKKPGTTQVKVGSVYHKVNVLTLDQSQTYEILQQAVKHTFNLKVKIDTAEIKIVGRMTRWRDWEILSEHCHSLNCEYTNHASLSNIHLLEAQQNIQKILSRFSLPKLNLNYTDHYFVLVPSQATYFDQITKALNPFGIRAVKDAQAIDNAPLVKIQITIAEIRKEDLTKIGLKWPSSYDAKIIPNSAPELGSLSYAALFLDKFSDARILASPNILCRSGKEAEFVAGGEFPVKIINYKFQDIIWKKYGVVLRVKPLADHSGRMSISIETEISSIDSARTVDGIPGLFINRVQSHFDLLEPKTIALSGLIKSEQARDSEGLPILSRLPIIGPLFSSKDFKENKSELVVFVRPEVISNSSNTEIKLPW